MSTHPLEVTNAISEVDRDLKALEATLAPLLNYSSLDQLNAQLTTADLLTVNTAIAFALNSLYCVCVRVCGEEFYGHPILQELALVKKYVREVQMYLRDGGNMEQREEPAATTAEAADSTSSGVPTRTLKGSTPVPRAPHLSWRQDLEALLGSKSPDS